MIKRFKDTTGLCRMGIHKWVKGKCARCGKKK